jgi:hypothetical protein
MFQPPTTDLETAQLRARVPILQRLRQRLAIKRQLVPDRAIQTQHLRPQNAIDQVQRRLQRLVDVVQVVRRRHPDDLQRKAEQVVVLEQLAGVQDPAGHVVEVHARERVYAADVAADAGEFRVLCDQGEGVEVELHEAVVDGGVVPVLRDLLVADAVFEAAVVGFVDAEEGAEDFVGWDDMSV